MSITDVILAEGRTEESALLSPSAKARTVSEVRPSAPVVCVPSVWELKQRVETALAGIVVRNVHLAEILDEGTNANNAWALRLHMEQHCSRDECFQGATILETEEVVETVLQS